MWNVTLWGTSAFVSGIAIFFCDMLLGHCCTYFWWEDRFDFLLVAFQEWVDNLFGLR